MNAKVKAKGSLSIDVKFIPTNRAPRFVAEMLVKTQGYEPRFLTSMSGACYATEVKLMDNVLQFGAVVVKSSYTKKVQVNNLGDTAVRYKWNYNQFRDIITISPEEGVLQSQSDF